MPESVGFPMAWWLSWFGVAFVVYAVLGVWFWRSARRHDMALSRQRDVRTGESRRGPEQA